MFVYIFRTKLADEPEKEALVTEKIIDPKIQLSGALLRDGKACITQNGHTLDPDKPPSSRHSVIKQILAAFVAQLGTVNTGMAFGFSAIAIPQLRDANSTIPITETQESWIGM